MTRPLRIALLTESTGPHGGVMHALALGDALASLGHEAVVHAPDPARRGFVRPTTCRTVSVPSSPLRCDTGVGGLLGSEIAEAGPNDAGRVAAVERGVGDYLAFFGHPDKRGFDVLHAQDGLSANALATMKARGWISGFARTVHHLDDVPEPHPAALERRAVIEADAHFVVNETCGERLKAAWGIAPTKVGNGVDTARFAPTAAAGDLILRRNLTLGSGPVFLAVGDIAVRNNTMRILDAFAQVFWLRPGAQLVIASGEPLPDHSACRAAFAATLAASGLPDHAVRRIGTMADADMPALYRNADTLLCPALTEGAGLAVLEAMACGIPVVAAAQPPSTDDLGDNDAIWCHPETTASIADAMMLSLLPAIRSALIPRGHAVAARHGWDAVARAHLPAYRKLAAAACA